MSPSTPTSRTPTGVCVPSLLGHRCRYVPSAVAYHMGSATTGGELDPFYVLLQRRNLLALLLKDLPSDFLLRNAPGSPGRRLHLLARSARAGMLTAHLRALVDLLRGAPRWLRARREIQTGPCNRRRRARTARAGVGVLSGPRPRRPRRCQPRGSRLPWGMSAAMIAVVHLVWGPFGPLPLRQVRALLSRACPRHRARADRAAQ